MAALLLAVAALGVSSSPASATPSFTGVASRTHSLDEVTDTAAEHAEHPGLHLVSAMAAWRVLEPADQVFDWTQMDTNVDAAREGGYRLILRIMAGRAAPGWLEAAGAEQFPLVGTDPNADDYCDRVTATLPWDPVLAEQYRQLMHELGLWLDQPDGTGGRKGDHIYLIPVSMPSYLGTEMVIGYGASVTCPGGTEAAGQNLRATNLAAWNTISTESERRARTEQAWRDAIDIHMTELPAQNDSVLAYGHLFLDGQAAALRIASDKVAQYPGRLWSMYTNLQPLVRSDGTLGPWREWCPVCHQTMLAAIQVGGTVGFQTADDSILGTVTKYRTAIDDALGSYPIAFLETGHDQVDVHEGYLLKDPVPVQDRIAQVVDNRITSTSVSCEPVTVAEPATCTATIAEFGSQPLGAPGGASSLTWSSSRPGTFSPSSCSPEGGSGVTSCSVTYTPASGSGAAHTVTGSYLGDPTHFPSLGTASLTVAERASSASVSCAPSSLVTGRTTSCTATVEDAGGALIPTGSVTWSSTSTGSFSPGSCTIAGSGGSATCSVSFIPSATGTHRVDASYGGSTDHLPSDSSENGATLLIAPDQPPTVSITFPANNANVPKSKTVVIAATAADDVGIVSVTFSVNGALRCTDTTAPYTCPWPVPKRANTKYTLTAIATDTANRTASHQIVVTAR
jgi:hypothetical protein